MKVALWIGGVVLALAAAAFLGLLLLARADLVSRHYSTLKDARADQLFERGWLPDILPASAHDIRTTNDVDTNTSEGEFWFASADYQAFASRLKYERGSQQGTFSEDGSTWLFACEEQRGYCEYTMWLEAK
jgi:hypothetical protein